jgi:threonine/homoserine/homoserine lactone efflux protein
MDLVIAAALGLGLGIVTGMPIGVVNVAIVDAVVAQRKRFAIGIGVGGALADAIHAALAFAGVGRLLTARPDLIRAFAIVAAALIAAYAIYAWRAPRRPKPIDTTNARSILAGFLLTLPNPGALSAWVAVAAVLLPAASIAESIVLAAGVGVGSAAWFAFLAWLVGRIPPEHRALRIIPKLAIVAFVAIAAVGLARVVS